MKKHVQGTEIALFFLKPLFLACLLFLCACGSKTGALFGKNALQKNAPAANTVQDAAASDIKTLFSEQISESRTLVSNDDQTCAISSAGKVACWGLETSQNDFVQTTLDLGEVSALSLSANTVCAIHKTNKTLIYQATDASPVEKNPPADGPRVAQVSVGPRHVCIVQENGLLRCWGANISAVQKVPAQFRARSVAVGTLHTCAIAAESNFVYCWGSDQLGQLSVPSSLTNAKAIFAKDFYSCALSDAGEVTCWGRLDGILEKRVAEEKQKGSRFKQLALGQDFICGLTDANQVQCFGNVDCGASSAPDGLKAYAISAGKYHACAIAMPGEFMQNGSKFSIDDGQMVCWGNYECEQTGAKKHDLDSTLRFLK